MNHQLEAEILKTLGLNSANYTKYALSGGDINEVWSIEGGDIRFVAKVNRSDRFPGMFQREKEGLELLATQSTGLGIPKVLALLENIGNESALILEWIESDPASNSEYLLGEGLAQLHQATAAMHGLNSDNYIGSLVQHNDQKKSWIAFWAEMRILDMAMRAERILGASLLRKIEAFVPKLADILPQANPSLLHGDLWGGNKMYSSEKAWLIDPAVYYGHSEVDLAMTRLFGGFGKEFYEAYHSVTPLTPGWEERNDIYQLYPLLVHVNLFGVSYVSGVERIIKSYS